MRTWEVRWNGKDGYEWDLFGPDSDKPIGGLWSDGLNSPHIKFILDACNAAEQAKVPSTVRSSAHWEEADISHATPVKVEKPVPFAYLPADSERLWRAGNVR